MQTIKLYIKDWLAIHPYIQQQATDRYFVDLANRLYSTCTIREIPESIKKKLCLYTAAYFEDVISGLGLWQAFIKKHLELYDTSLPFYTIGTFWHWFGWQGVVGTGITLTTCSFMINIFSKK